MRNTGRYVSVQLLKILLLYAGSNHYDLDALFKSSNIDAEVLKNKTARIDIDKFCSMVSALADISGYEPAGLHIAEKVGNIYSKNHILMTIMSNCSNFEEAIEKLIQYHDISSNYLKLHLKKQAEFVELICETEIQIQPNLDRIFLEAALALCTIMFSDLTMGKARFIGIHFHHSESVEQNEYQRFFNCPVIFNSIENKIIISNDDLLLPIVLSDPDLLDMLELYARKILSKGSNDCVVSEKVMNIISEMIIQVRDFTIGKVAQNMAVSVRTLQKQLKEENTSYRKLLEQAKMNIAIKNLDNKETSLTDIAFLLGFSEQSAFNHSFKNWTGLTPRKYREQDNS